MTGAVDIATTPSVQYTYSGPSNGSLLTSMIYPNGRAIDYSYGSGLSNANAALDQAIGRLDAIVDSANSGDSGQVLEQYSYLGLSTIVARNRPQSSVSLVSFVVGSIGAGGDQYVGLDQLGRVVNQNWVNASTGASVDNYTYSYDADGNVTAKNNVLDSAYSETYTYDSLNRLTSTARNGAAYQSWNLDSQGNWSGFTNQGATQTETANSQNQITSISGQATPTYDANGNMIGDQNGNTLIYDGWNRLVEVEDSSGQVIAQYSYNAMNYAVTVTYPQGNSQIPAGTTNYIYYSNQWQVIEVRTGGTSVSNVSTQIVWSAAYVNAAILQDAYSGGVIEPDSRLYFLQDANWGTTAVVGYDPSTQTWGVVQRYVYDSYGNITILNADWSATPTGTAPVVNALYQGMQYDPITGLYYGRARWYSPSLGRWISQDPAGYVNGANEYQMEMGGPAGGTDALGLFVYARPYTTVTMVHSGKCPTLIAVETIYVNYGDIAVPYPDSPGGSLDKVLRAILEGVGKFSGLVGAVDALVNSLTGNGALAYIWTGWSITTIRTVTTETCTCPPHVTGTTTTRSTAGPFWSDTDQPAAPDGGAADKAWLESLQSIADEFNK